MADKLILVQICMFGIKGFDGNKNISTGTESLCQKNKNTDIYSEKNMMFFKSLVFISSLAFSNAHVNLNQSRYNIVSKFINKTRF